MTRRISFTVVIGLLLVFSANVVLYAQSQPDHVKVVVGAGQLGTSNTFIAEAEGYFAAQNIEVEYVEVGSTQDAETLALLISGQVDVLQAPWTPGLFNAITRGAQIKVVAAPTVNDPEYCPYGGYVVRAGEAATFTLESLRGASVSIGSGSSLYGFERWLQSHDMHISDVVLEDVPSAARAEALYNGTIDLTSMVEPGLSRSINELGFELVNDINQVSPDATIAVLLYGPNMLNREDDLPVRYLTAYLQGAHKFNEGPTERNIEILSPALELEPEILTEICWIRYRETGLLNGDTALDYMYWLNDQGMLDEPLELDEFYDPSYVEEAYERLMAMNAPEATETAAQ
jgi:ABC-type nitrate/sulfonate/bicarbonate transport system substrate-binding protein